MMSMTFFISGRVNGLPREEAERKFDKAEKLLMLNGYASINPLKLCSPGMDDCDAMEILLPRLASKHCDGILLLNDSAFSGGSHAEETVARYLKKQILYEEDLD